MYDTIYTASKNRLIEYAEYVQDNILAHPGEPILLFNDWLKHQKQIEENANTKE